MSRPRIEQPKYSYHISGQARVTLDDQTIDLGEYDSVESNARYHALLARYNALLARYNALLARYNANGKRLPDDTAIHQAEQPADHVRCVIAELEWSATTLTTSRPTPRSSTGFGYAQFYR